jgi:hypothetical protein
MKMGDSPAVTYVLGPHPENPQEEFWGGHYVRAWDRPRVTFDRAPTVADVVETYAIMDLRYRPEGAASAGATASLVVDKQEFRGFADGQGVWHFVFSPKLAKTWSYEIKSTHPGLNGKTGGFTSVNPAPELMKKPSARYPNWWTDDLDPSLSEGIQQGAKTISRWREAFLKDFAERMEWCTAPAKG